MLDSIYHTTKNEIAKFVPYISNVRYYKALQHCDEHMWYC